MAAITSIVAQNTKGVQHIHNLEISWVQEQLDSVFNDELPHAIKTGMIATHETMELIQHYLKQHSDIPYVMIQLCLLKVVIHLWMMILRNIYRIHYYL